MTNQSRPITNIKKLMIGVSIIIFSARVYFILTKQDHYTQTSNSISITKQENMGEGLQVNKKIDNEIPAKVIVKQYENWYVNGYGSIMHTNTMLAAAEKTGDYEQARGLYSTA